MFVILLTYKAPLAEVDKLLLRHREFLDPYYETGLFILSGPQKPRIGGVIVAATNDRAYLESVIQQDPYYKADIADYQLIEFTPVKHCPALKKLIQESEGELC